MNYIYRMTHIDNIPHILQYGITHKSSPNSNPCYKTIGDIDIINKRKYDKSAEGALAQIREKNYPETLAGLSVRILLVGINYDSKSKKHECRIEEIKGFGNCQ